MQALKMAIADLTDTNTQFLAGDISPLQHGTQREKALGDALEAVADHYGVELKRPLRIDARGEFDIHVKHPDSQEMNVCGKYTQEFAEVLNKYDPRTGVFPGAVLTDSAGWCSMNHFSVEKMVTEQLAQLSPQRSPRP